MILTFLTHVRKCSELEPCTLLAEEEERVLKRVCIEEGCVFFYCIRLMFRKGVNFKSYFALF